VVPVPLIGPHHNSSCMWKAFEDCLKEIGGGAPVLVPRSAPDRERPHPAGGQRRGGPGDHGPRHTAAAGHVHLALTSVVAHTVCGMRSLEGSVGGLVLTLAALSSCRGEPPPEASGTEMRSSTLSEPDIVQDLASAKSGNSPDDDDRFEPAEAACPLSDEFIPAPLTATWRLYRTKTQESKVTSTHGTVTLSTNGTGFSAAGDSIL
jgi:hypothetical protein